MSILINKDTKVITQGITGKTGQFHTRKVHRLRQRQELLRRRRQPEEGRRRLRIPSTVPKRKPLPKPGHRSRDLRAAQAMLAARRSGVVEADLTWRSASPKAFRSATCWKCATR